MTTFNKWDLVELTVVGQQNQRLYVVSSDDESVTLTMLSPASILELRTLGWPLITHGEMTIGKSWIKKVEV
jgi:hypothetical protein